jgi:hypothetical protein
MSTNRAKQGRSDKHQQTTTRTHQKTSIEHNKEIKQSISKERAQDYND